MLNFESPTAAWPKLFQKLTETLITHRMSVTPRSFCTRMCPIRFGKPQFSPWKQTLTNDTCRKSYRRFVCRIERVNYAVVASRPFPESRDRLCAKKLIV